MANMLTPHSFKPVLHARDSYRLYEWACSCGAPCTSPRTRSKITAELGFWRDHALPDAVPERHTCTLVPGAFENAIMWTCSCGEYDEPRGRANERWAWQSHRAHENRALVQWYRAEWVRRKHDQTEEEYAEFVRLEWNQKYEERERSRRPLDPAIAKMLLDKLI